jgi:hypothetical protein
VRPPWRSRAALDCGAARDLVALAPPIGLASKLDKLGQGKRHAQLVPFHLDPDRLAVSGLHAMAASRARHHAKVESEVGSSVLCYATWIASPKVLPERPPVARTGHANASGQ